MDYVLLATHGPEICPTSNATTRELMNEMGPQIPKVAEQAGVKILAGPYVSREHTTVVIVQAGTGEALDQFLVESRLPQWNSVRVLPVLTMQAAMQEINDQPAIY